MKKRIISILLACMICITAIPTATLFPAQAANGIQEKINKVLAVYPNGSYFTVASSTSGCTSSNHDIINGVWCTGCYLPSIPSRGGLPSGKDVGYTADTCCGFATYVFYCIYGHHQETNTTKKTSPVFGDLVHTGKHWFIYLSEDSNNYYVYDANGYNYGGKNKVQYNNYYPKSAVTALTVYHANNYDQVKNTGSFYYLDVNGYLDGADTGNIEGWGTFDVYVNDKQTANDVTDYYTEHQTGASYRIDDIKPVGCHQYDGVQTGSLTGTIGKEKVNVRLAFSTQHSYDEGQITTNATCSEDGVITFTCTKCGKTKTEPVSKLNHAYGAWTKLDDTLHQRVCANDASHVETAPHTWNDGEILTAATCTTPGTKRYTCTVCSCTKEAPYLINEANATWTDWDEALPPADAFKTESKVQYRSSVKETTTGSNATMTGWTQTGSTYSSWGSWSGWSTTPATADDLKQVEKTALYRYYCFECPNCGARDPWKGACSGCNKVSLDSPHFKSRLSEIAYSKSNYATYGKPYTTSLGDGKRWYFSLGNLNDTAIGTKDADSDAVVIEQGYRCRTRTVTYTFERWSDFSDWQDEPIAADDNTRVETRTVYRYIKDAPITDHTWNSGVTENGYTTYTCTVCGATKTEEHEHYFAGMGGIIKTPTCTEPGLRERTCALCGETFTFEIPASGHAYGDWTKLNDAQHQRVCAYDASHVETENHAWNGGETVNGKTVYTCTVCGAVKEESPEPEDPDVIIAAASVNARPGQTVTVDLNLTKVIPFSYLRLTLSYDKSALTLEKAENSGIFDQFDNDFNLTFSNKDNVNVLGKIATLTFTVSEDAAEGEYEIKLIARECYTVEEETVSAATQAGKITVLGFVIGDVTGDGVIDGRDVIRLRKYLANLDDETGVSTIEISDGADCTGDGNVDGRDLIRLRKYLANLDDETGVSTIELG